MDLVWLSSQNTSVWSNFTIMADRPNFEVIPVRYHIYVIVLYSCTSLVALVGNSLTLVVLKSGKRTSRNLSKYLINLSVADLLMASMSIPFTYTSFMYGQWFFSPAFCPIVMSSQVCSVFVSVYTLVAIGIDRYIAIKMPLRSKTILNMTNGILAVIWVFGLISAALEYHFHTAFEVVLRNETIFVCRDIFDESEARLSMVILFVVIFLVPVSILVYVYSSMAVVIFQRDLTNSAASMLKRQRRKIIKILMVVVEAFVFCWSPLQLYQIVSVFVPSVNNFETESQLNSYAVVLFAVHWLAMAHSAVNPLIYSFMSQSFRKEFVNIFFRKFNFRGKSTSVQYIEN